MAKRWLIGCALAALLAACGPDHGPAADWSLSGGPPVVSPGVSLSVTAFWDPKHFSVTTTCTGVTCESVELPDVDGVGFAQVIPTSPGILHAHVVLRELETGESHAYVLPPVTVRDPQRLEIRTCPSGLSTDERCLQPAHAGPQETATLEVWVLAEAAGQTVVANPDVTFNGVDAGCYAWGPHAGLLAEAGLPPMAACSATVAPGAVTIQAISGGITSTRTIFVPGP